MTEWLKSRRSDKRPVDFLVVQETALAMAQATIQNVLNESGLKRSELADRMGRPRSFISRMLRGSHNLTIKTFALALAACGFEPNFGYLRLQWGSMAGEPVPIELVSEPVPIELPSLPSLPSFDGQFRGNASSVATELLVMAIAH